MVKIVFCFIYIPVDIHDTLRDLRVCVWERGGGVGGGVGGRLIDDCTPTRGT